MSGFESLMWTLESDPRLSSNIANLTLLDRAPDLGKFRERLELAVADIPRFHQRVAPPALGVGAPQWVTDDAFDLDRHLLHVDLGRVSRRRLLDEVMEHVAAPFDRDHPLWQFVVFDGLRDGRSAMLQRLHHTVTDGEGGLRVSLKFIDFERTPGTGAPIPPSAQASAPPQPGGWQTRVASVVSGTARAMEGARNAAVEVTRHAVSPSRLLDDARTVVEQSASILRQANLADQRLSPLWTEHSTARHLDLTDVALDEVRAAAHALGGSVNDLFVTAITDAAGRYHRRHGHDVDYLRMSMPISLRQGVKDASNHFTPTQTVVPVGQMAPATRFTAIQALLAHTRDEPGMTRVDNLASLLNLLPPPVVTRLGVRAAGTVDFVTSNLRAAPIDVFMAGALVESNYPIGPLATTAFNVTTMSYRGRMWMGVVSDPAAIDDPEGLTRDVNASLRDLLRSAGGM